MKRNPTPTLPEGLNINMSTDDHKSSSCRKCGRALKNPQSVRLGIGPVCLAKEIGQRRPKRIILHSAIIPRLFDVEMDTERRKAHC